MRGKKCTKPSQIATVHLPGLSRSCPYLTTGRLPADMPPPLAVPPADMIWWTSESGLTARRPGDCRHGDPWSVLWRTWMHHIITSSRTDNKNALLQLLVNTHPNLNLYLDLWPRLSSFNPKLKFRGQLGKQMDGCWWWFFLQSWRSWW